MITFWRWRPKKEGKGELAEMEGGAPLSVGSALKKCRTVTESAPIR